MSLMEVVLTFSFLIFNSGQPISLGHRKLSLGATLLYLKTVFLTRSTLEGTCKFDKDQNIAQKEKKNVVYNPID